jgi:SAM-dependent methyltransferase
MALSGVLVAAVQSGITAAVARRPATTDELADQLGLDRHATRLLVDCLASVGCMRMRAGRYQLRRRAGRWLDPGSPQSIAQFIDGCADYWSWWSQLPAVVRQGEPIRHHEHPPTDPYWHRYIAGQYQLARLSAAPVAAALRLPPNARRLLDIGGGHGWYAAELCRRRPQLQATVLDLPGSAAIGRRIIAEAGLADRVHHRDGDARDSELDGPYDGIICFNLVHHLQPIEIRELFTRARAALRPGGSFAVLDAFAPTSRRTAAAAAMLSMFMYLSSGAQAYTRAELQSWLIQAGFGPARAQAIRRLPGLTLFQVIRAG